MTAALTTDELWTSDFPGLSGSALELARKVPKSKGKSFSQHWAERFANAIAARGVTPPRITPEAVLNLFPVRSRSSWFFSSTRNIDGDLEDQSFVAEPGVIYAQLHTRQGGGNRDCWCDTDTDNDEHEDYCVAVNNDLLQSHPDYILDYDDSFDSTYANLIYRTSLTEDDLKRFAEENALASLVATERAAVESINSLKATPWSILAEGKTAEIFERMPAAKQALEVGRRSANPTALSFAEELLATAGTLLSGGTADVEGTYGKNSQVIPQKLGVRDWNYGLLRILDLFESLSKHNGELAEVQARFDQASELPEGSELWNYLLKDRGTSSYTTTEKVGRRNMKVQKTYERGSLLGSELKAAQEHVNSRTKDLARYIGEVQTRRDALAEVQAKVDALEVEVTELEAKIWSAGWPGRTQAPEVPVEVQV